MKVGVQEGKKRKDGESHQQGMQLIRGEDQSHNTVDTKDDNVDTFSPDTFDDVGVAGPSNDPRYTSTSR